MDYTPPFMQWFMNKEKEREMGHVWILRDLFFDQQASLGTDCLYNITV